MIRVFGDTHGKNAGYLRHAGKAEYSVHLGDVGFKYDDIAAAQLDPAKHKIVGGNHDAYHLIVDVPNYAGNFGYFTMDKTKIFFIRGAYSVDKDFRTYPTTMAKWGKTWWEQEELEPEIMDQAVEMYSETKPKVVVSHDCPASIAAILSNPTLCERYGLPLNFRSQTQRGLERMLNFYRPKVWLFGHWHKPWQAWVGETHFICVGENKFHDLYIEEYR